MHDPDAFQIPDSATLEEILPAYEIESFIAAGGMGVVFKARQKSLDRLVALKILPREFGEDPVFRSSFRTEARAMARLNHPNLIAVYDCGEAEGLPFIAMEYVDGCSLFTSANGRAIDPEQAVGIILKISSGLAHAHAAGIIHRDIKPANILLTKSAEPKIGDFGLACRIEAAPELCMGTPGYVAPEVIARPDMADKRSDLFAVGMILHELLTGLEPASAGERPPVALCGIDPGIDRIWKRAVHPEPGFRYPSIEEFIRDLEIWQSSRVRKPALSQAPAAVRAPARNARPPLRATSRHSSPQPCLAPGDHRDSVSGDRVHVEFPTAPQAGSGGSRDIIFKWRNRRAAEKRQPARWTADGNSRGHR